MNLGDKIIELRKQIDLNREELGKVVGTSGAMIGKYERNEMNPSVGMAQKIAQALDVSLDYLTGDTSVLIKDRKMIKRLEDIQTLDSGTKTTLFQVIDTFLRDAKARTAYAH